MEQGKLGCVEHFLGIWLDFLTVFCLEMAVYVFFQQKLPGLWRLWLPFLLPLLFWLFREKVRWLWLFLGLHLAAGYLVFLAAEGWILKVLYALCGICYGGYSIWLLVHNRTAEWEGEVQLSGEGIGSSPAAAGLMAALVFGLSVYQGREEVQELVLAAALLYVPAFFLKQYVGNFGSYMQVNRLQSGEVPLKKSFRTGVGIVLGYSLAGAVCLAAGMGGKLTAVLQAGFKRLLWSIAYAGAWVLSLLFGGAQTEQSLPMESGGEAAAMEVLPPAEPRPAWLEFLLQLADLAVIVLLTALLLYGLWRLIRYLRQVFYAGAASGGRQETLLYTEEKEKLKPVRPFAAFRLPRLGKSPAERVREAFRRTALRYPYPEKPDYETRTARELAAQDGAAENRAYQELAALYEAARYGQQETGPEEAGRAAAAAREALRESRR